MDDPNGADSKVLPIPIVLTVSKPFCFGNQNQVLMPSSGDTKSQPLVTTRHGCQEPESMALALGLPSGARNGRYSHHLAA